MTSPSSDDERNGSVEDRDSVAYDLTQYVTEDPDEWDEFWDSEPLFEKWPLGGRQWR